jgi:hypothetical protein
MNDTFHEYRVIWQVEFLLHHIAAIPFNTNGKMRVSYAKITHKLSRRRLAAIRAGGSPK